MPILNVKLSKQPSPETTQQVATALTDLTSSILKKKRELTAVLVNYLPPDEWFICGETLTQSKQQSFALDIKITEGTNTKDEKARYVEAVFNGMQKILGTQASASYVVIHEVRADSWGYAGQTQEYRYIQGKAL